VEFARTGAKVVALDLDQDSSDTTAELARKEGTETLYIPTDVTDRTAFRPLRLKPSLMSHIPRPGYS
jgi:NAD(P)-dependent dehydrogenase (short-subunit alcohol dehydrogenase family)